MPEDAAAGSRVLGGPADQLAEQCSSGLGGQAVSRVPILLAGAGGHARACIDVIEQEGRFVVGGLVGLSDEVGGRLLGYPVIGTDEDLGALSAEFRHAM